MTVKCWVNVPGFKIRKKSDVHFFLNRVLESGDFYFVNDSRDMVLHIKAGAEVSVKFGEAFNIFTPEIVLYDSDIVDYVYLFRKHINRDLFSPIE